MNLIKNIMRLPSKYVNINYIWFYSYIRGGTIMANRLELTWYGKDEPIRVEPRLLIENTELSNISNDSDTGNMLIHGDNLLALKALEKDYAGQVKCIYIDPPYNTGSAFEHYDDNLEHSQWLNLMRPRLEILRSLLSDDGFIFVQIDTYEMAYLKVLMDEIFGRKNFVNDIVWKRKGGSVNPKNRLNNNTDYILWYAKTEAATITPVYSLNDEETQEYIRKRFTYLDENGRRYRLSPIISPTYSPTLVYEYKGYIPPKNGWSLSLAKMQQFEQEGRLYMPKDKSQRIQRKQYLDEYKGRPIGNLWTDINVINPMSTERRDFVGQKPECLIERVLMLATQPGDFILDSFLGSGTTAAVAHKMGRRYIGIEMGEHAYTHCKVRLDKVIAGEDQGGITKSADWHGGGGYRFYELAPTLINRDAFGEYVINEKYDADMLAAAIALHEGFQYQPDKNLFWKQSVGNENSYLFVTTRHLNGAYLDSIKDTMQDGEYLIIACKSFDNGIDKAYDNIVIKKIPQMLLRRCEFGKDDYALNIVHPPIYEDEEMEGNE